jgi:uncharacterized protein
MVFILAAPAMAEELKSPRVLSVAGHGEVRAAPTMATVSLGVFKNAMTAKDALAANTEAMTALFAALRAAGIADADMQTSNFSVSPRYDYRTDNQPVANGFDVSNNVTVVVRKLDLLGGILDAAVTAGANQINGVTFSIEKPEAAMDEARKLAVADARRKAEVYGQASRVTLGDVLSISEGGSYQPQPVIFARAKMEASADVPIAQGEQVIAVDVNIAWEIK